MKIVKNKRVKTTKIKDCYDISVELTTKELYKLLPPDSNTGGNVIIDSISEMFNKKFNKIYNNNWFDSWELKNKNKIIKLSFILEIFKE